LPTQPIIIEQMSDVISGVGGKRDSFASRAARRLLLRVEW
jgi:hypothetical protein